MNANLIEEVTQETVEPFTQMNALLMCALWFTSKLNELHSLQTQVSKDHSDIYSYRA